jgi:hypothetical protein
MVGSAVENQKDVLPGKLVREDIKKRPGSMPYSKSA